MDVEINGRHIQVAEGHTTLGQLLAAEGFNGIGQAVAVHNRVVPKVEWENFPLTEGMKITVIRAICGG
ncbi:MAG: sulfur carrier protein ThiS [Bacteroidales bacterium]|nr:sulfur carrier protein ThiS [Bacteroidales bacterium]